MKKYLVLDNGFPAKDRLEFWTNNEFYSFQEARSFARRWLGEFVEDDSIKLNTPVPYNPHGDKIEIREIEALTGAARETISKYVSAVRTPYKQS